jgi:Flp pilus assembly pilin Flp
LVKKAISLSEVVPASGQSLVQGPRRKGIKRYRRSIMRHFLCRFHKDENGTAMVEYSVLLAIVLGVAIATLTALGTNITRILGLVNDLLTSVVAA